jgi:transglutaminase-like putative cysteine protease
VPGSSRPTDGAVETLLAGVGVCRDYAHLTIAVLRALDVPARLVAVYAPGCAPMDFHAVVEAAVDDRWYVVDPTGLAPRSALLRISTGRDAADTAFLTNHGGSVQLRGSVVTAVVDGDLPVDRVEELMVLRLPGAMSGGPAVVRAPRPRHRPAAGPAPRPRPATGRARTGCRRGP